MTTTNLKHKTVMCEFINISHGCRYGANCTHAHNILELKGSDSDPPHWWRHSWVPYEDHQGFTEWVTRPAWASQDKSEEARTVWAAPPANPAPLTVKSNTSAVFRRGRHPRTRRGSSRQRQVPMGQQANPMQCPMLQADYPVVIPAPPAPVSQILQEWSTAYNLETAYFRSVEMLGHIVLMNKRQWADTAGARWAAWEEPEPNNEKPIGDEIDAVSRWPAYLVSIESTEKSPDQDDKACPDTMMISLDAIQGSSPTVQQLESNAGEPEHAQTTEADAVAGLPSDESIGSTERSPDQADKACPGTMMRSLNAIQESPTVQQLESYESIGSAGTSGGQADEELPETMRKSFSARFVSLVHTCQRRRCH